MGLGNWPQPSPRTCLSILVCILTAFLPCTSVAAQQAHGTEVAQMTTGAVQQGNYDAQRRPITAGGTVATGPMIFKNATAESGLGSWRNVTGGPDKKLIIEAKGSGVCLIDFDHDGWLDIYLVNGSTFAAQEERKTPHRTPRSSAIITTAHSPTSPQRPASPTSVGGSAAPSETTTTMAGPTCT